MGDTRQSTRDEETESTTADPQLEQQTRFPTQRESAEPRTHAEPEAQVLVTEVPRIGTSYHFEHVRERKYVDPLDGYNLEGKPTQPWLVVLHRRRDDGGRPLVDQAVEHARVPLRCRFLQDRSPDERLSAEPRVRMGHRARREHDGQTEKRANRQVSGGRERCFAHDDDAPKRCHDPKDLLWSFSVVRREPAITNLTPVNELPLFTSPRLTSYNPIPDHTPSRLQLTGWVVLPPEAVTVDGFQSQYYILKRFSWWRKEDWRVRDGGKEERFDKKVFFGIEKKAGHTVQRTISASITPQIGLAVTAITASLAGSLTAGLGVTVVREERISYGEELNFGVTYPASSDGIDRASASWIREDNYRLLDVDGALRHDWWVTTKDHVERSWSERAGELH